MRAAMSEDWHCRHSDCVYRTIHNTAHRCDYFFITGKLRTAGLDPEAAKPCSCTAYTPSKKRRAAVVVKPPKRNDADTWRQKAVDLAKQGLTIAQIATTLGRHPSTIAGALRAAGVQARHPDMTRYDWSRAYELWEDGASLRGIADDLGCSISAVKKWVNNHLKPKEGLQ